MLDLKDPSLYINRELSWLQFNTRVLQEAQNQNHPLLERLKFLAIYGTNLDEFYMIRVAGLKKLYKAMLVGSGPDKLTPVEQLKEIRAYLNKEKDAVEACYKDIVGSLVKEGIVFKTYENLAQSEKENLDEYFYENVYPMIIPIAVDSTHPFPTLNNLGFGLILKLCDIENEKTIKYGLIRIARTLPRFVEINDGEYMLIEDLVANNIEKIFPGYKLVMSTPFRVTRNADISIQEEEADDFMEILEEGLRLRKKGEFVRLEVGNSADQDLLKFFNNHTRIDEEDTYKYDIILNLGSLWQIVGNKNYAHLSNPPFMPKNLPPFDGNYDIFDVLDHQDVMLYHPYDSFDPVVKLIQKAAKDPSVVAIRMTMYRMGKNSPIVKALIDAAEDGKQVTAMVELKARFDEENNVVWAKALENAGAHVIYGIKGFKVHAKAALVIRKVGNKLKQYVHLGTGNYNQTTARIYTDVSYLTSKEEITKDVVRFFHFLTGFSKRGKLNRLYMSPTQIKPKIISMINNEASKGSEGHIIAKTNSLVDEDVIRALYKASQAGCKVELIIRGICGLRPGIKGISENIRVVSIIGKYLEHPRLFYFKHAAPQVYISSADWMPRNLIRRVELLTAIEDEEIVQKLINVLQLQCNDNVLSHELQSDGSYIKRETDSSRVINNHNLLEAHVNKIHKAVKKDAPNYIQQLANRLFKES